MTVWVFLPNRKIFYLRKLKWKHIFIERLEENVKCQSFKLCFVSTLYTLAIVLCSRLHLDWPTVFTVSKRDENWENRSGTSLMLVCTPQPLHKTITPLLVIWSLVHTYPYTLHYLGSTLYMHSKSFVLLFPLRTLYHALYHTLNLSHTHYTLQTTLVQCWLYSVLPSMLVRARSKPMRDSPNSELTWTFL